MIIAEQVYTQAILLAGELEPKREALLKTLCRGAVASLISRLRDGLTEADCGADLVSAASLYALAALNDVGDGECIEQFSAGDVTIRTGRSNAASNCLRHQAQWIIAPYLKDAFSFQGV